MADLLITHRRQRNGSKQVQLTFTPRGSPQPSPPVACVQAVCAGTCSREEG